MNRCLAYVLLTILALSGCSTPRPLMFEGEMPRSGFSGQVVWAGSGHPVADAVVLIGGTGLRAETNEEGAFAFEEIPLGT